DVIGKDFSLAVMWFFDHCSFAKGCNSSFIALIPKCLDPKAVNDYRPISLIGILYKVVTKILATRLSSVFGFCQSIRFCEMGFLDDVLRSFGFGSKWRSWINGSLASGKASVLVNGSPTSEFQFYCGLKQGDPLAPYLFLLVMESLHYSFLRVVEAGSFKGINFNGSTSISHLFYADDAVFIG
nr:RNA-directed DNA polymerase, eukaryota [Tanacetum cinerariifolium]